MGMGSAGNPSGDRARQESQWGWGTPMGMGKGRNPNGMGNLVGDGEGWKPQWRWETTTGMGKPSRFCDSMIARSHPTRMVPWLCPCPCPHCQHHSQWVMGRGVKTQPALFASTFPFVRGFQTGWKRLCLWHESCFPSRKLSAKQRRGVRPSDEEGSASGSILMRSSQRRCRQSCTTAREQRQMCGSCSPDAPTPLLLLREPGVGGVGGGKALQQMGVGRSAIVQMHPCANVPLCKSMCKYSRAATSPRTSRAPTCTFATQHEEKPQGPCSGEEGCAKERAIRGWLQDMGKRSHCKQAQQE